MKIYLYTVCYNEIDILPWVIDYWKRIPITKAVVYDNGSKDGTLEYLSQFEWIEIRHFQTDGHNDSMHAFIKNTAWKDAKGEADYVVVCDMDEVLWGDIESELKKMKEGGYNVLGNPWYALCGDEYPKYEEGKYLHQLVKRGYKQYINHMPQFEHLGKFMVIDPNITESTNWSVGNHILFDIKPFLKLYVTDKIITFHFNKGFGEDYFVRKRKSMYERLSSFNKSHGMGVEYGYPIAMIREEYRRYQAESVDISNL